MKNEITYPMAHRYGSLSWQELLKLRQALEPSVYEEADLEFDRRNAMIQDVYVYS